MIQASQGTNAKFYLSSVSYKENGFIILPLGGFGEAEFQWSLMFNICLGTYAHKFAYYQYYYNFTKTVKGNKIHYDLFDGKMHQQ